MDFIKMHGLGNDYILLERGACDEAELAQLARQLCERRRGVGADGLLYVTVPPPPGAQLAMRIFNADGSEAEMCGNGLRCAVRHAVDTGLVPAGDLVVMTGAGPRRCRSLAGNLVETDLGAPLAPIRTMVVPGVGTVTLVDLGNPHAVLFVDADRLDSLDLPVLGPLATRFLASHAGLKSGVNIEWMVRVSIERLRQRTWERGVGETPACGSGAGAAAIAAHYHGYIGRRVTLQLTGGELEIELREEADGLHPWKTGPAVTTFRGRTAGAAFSRG